MKTLDTLLHSFCLLLAAALVVPLHAAEKEFKNVGLTVGDLGNPFFIQIRNGAQSKVKEISPDAKFNSQSSGYDINKQTNQIDDFISSGADLILLGAADSKGIAPSVKKAKAAGVAVVAVDVGAEGGVDATVMSDNRQAGELAAQYIVDRLKGQGQIVILNGPPVTSIQDRVAGALEVFKKSPGIKILSQDQNTGSTRDGGLRIMTDLLTANPKIDAVFTINDESGIGADLAAKQAQRNEFFIVGVDGSPDAVQALKRKDSLFVATAAQDPYAMAQKAVQVAADVMNGKKPETEPVLVPVTLVTREKIDEYKGWTK